MTSVSPVNRTPLLVCEGSCEGARVHTFVRKETITRKCVVGRVDTEEVLGRSLQFRCDTCGNERRYGYES